MASLQSLTNFFSLSFIYATVVTVTTPGVYRTSATVYPTTLSSSAWNVEVACSLAQKGSAGAANQTYELNNCTIGTPLSSELPSSMVIEMPIHCASWPRSIHSSSWGYAILLALGVSYKPANKSPTVHADGDERGRDHLK